MKIIGLGYKRRRGKDTVADFIVREYGYKKISMSEDYIIPEYIDYFKKTPNKSEICDYGMLRRKRHGEDYWLKKISCDIYGSTGTNFVWPNVRFPNEANWVRKYGILARIDRHQSLLINAEDEGSRTDDTPTETALDDFKRWDVIILNNASFAYLRAQVQAMMERYA